ncbi:MAG: hypothetical protein JSW63_05990 [Ignavibacterium sp.]|nr:MAG: hypothetical protein JSW63_05990 [Ignavibacterium sp.]
MVKTIIEKNLLDEVEKTTEIILKRKIDLQTIVDECLNNNLEEEFEELVFTGKYIEGLKRVLKKGGDFQEIENLDYVKKDLGENMEKVIEQVKGIMLNSSDETKKYFEETYLTLSASAFQNLNDLFADLEQVKKYLNFQKRNK